jgi:DNA-binding CsgD family transcriptional regulator
VAEIPQVDVAHVVALIGHWATPRRTAALLGRPAGDVRAALDQLVSDGVLSRADRPTFSVESDREALIAGIGLVRAQTIRAAAAALLAAEGERLAAGMLLLDVDPAGNAQHAALLWDAATMAGEQNDPDVAILLLKRLLAEPPVAAMTSSALVALGTAEVRTGVTNGQDTLRAALNEASQPDQIADAASALAWALAGHVRGEDAAAALVEARERLLAEGSAPDASLDVQIADMSAWDAGLKEARRTAVARLNQTGGSALASAAVLAARATDAIAAAEPAAETAELCQRALANGALANSPRGAPTALAMGMFLGYTGRGAQGIDQLDHVISRLRANDLTALIGPATAFRGAVKLMLGRLADAETDLRAIVGSPWLVRSTPLMTGFLLLCLLEQGKEDAAAQLLANLRLEGGDVQRMIPHAPFLYARAELRARRGDPHAALADLLRCGEWLAEGGWVNPAIAGWRGSAARILVSQDRRTEAQTLAAEEVRLAERFGEPAGLARALRAQATTVDAPHAGQLLARAVNCTDVTHTAVEHTAALIDLAAWEISAGALADARPRLHTAWGLAEQTGASARTRRAGELLHAAGGRARPTDPNAGAVRLTRTELRVARLAATGLTNAEISRQLVVSPKTTESHLRSVFQKLGISSRAQLPALIPAEETASPGGNAERPDRAGI